MQNYLHSRQWPGQTIDVEELETTLRTGKLEITRTEPSVQPT